jgi:hypothetical protein
MSISSPHSKLSTLALAGLITLGIVFGLMTAPASGETNHEIEEGIFEGQGALNFLNEQRAANGIPPLALNQTLAASWCPNEDEDLGIGVQHDLSGDGDWAPDYSPWDLAPLHQFSEYSPIYTEAGIVNSGMDASEGCLGVGGVSPEPPEPTFYAFVSDLGPSDVPLTEDVNDEGPIAVQEAVGIPEGTATGPQLLLYARGMSGEVPYYANQARVLSWSLTSAGGSLVSGTHLVDEAVMAGAGGLFSEYARNLTGGAVLIPPPLPLGGYSLSVTWEGASGVVATQALTFTVATQEWERLAAVPEPSAPREKAKRHKARRHTARHSPHKARHRKARRHKAHHGHAHHLAPEAPPSSRSLPTVRRG